MSESMSPNSGDTGDNETKPPRRPTRHPRMWPAALIVVAYVVTWVAALLGPTMIMNAVGVYAAPLAATLLLAIWWLFFSRVPWLERVVGMFLFAATLAWIVFTQSHDGLKLLLIALPVLTTSIVAVSLLTARLSARIRRRSVLAVMLGCAVVFPMFRVADVSSSLAPILAWRWSPTPEEALADTWAALPPAGKADVPAQAGPLDWPGFRGPARDGRVEGVRFSTNWSTSPPKELWRTHVGLGYSSFAVAGDYAFTQEQRGNDEYVLCYRASTGEIIWGNAVAARFEDSTGTGPRATPTFDAGKLYTQGATGILQCLDASTGAVIWSNDIKSETGARLPTWGFASSPLVMDNEVIVFAGGSDDKSVVAYDKATGGLAWCGGSGKNGYASAQLSTVAGVPQVLMTSSFGVQGLAVDTGAVLWENQWETSMNPRVVQPLVYDGNMVLVGTAEGKGTRCLQLAKSDASWTVEEKWTTKKFRPYFNDFVFHNGFCYGFDGNTLTCIDARTGERRWRGSQYGGQVLLMPDIDTLLVMAEKGYVALVRAIPDSFEEIARFTALTGKTWNHPVVANGKLLVRNAEEAACFELPAP